MLHRNVRRWLPQHATTPDTGDAQSLTGSYITLGAQFDLGSYEQIVVMMRHKAGGAGETLSFKVDQSLDDMETDEASSVWHPIGDQSNAGGTLSEEGWEYVSNASADTSWRGMVALAFPVVAKKGRIQVKASAAAGQALAALGLTPIRG